MQWKQFFTPVNSINADQGKKIIAETPPEHITILDVRQPSEYETNHIPGAKLIPLPQLTDRLGELDPGRTILAYCAVGGRSRIAAQMLAGRGFKMIYNLSGGIKAWDGDTAIGSEVLGIELFSGHESSDKTLIIAYSLEQGLRDFYLSMLEKVKNPAAASLFRKLADVELIHQGHIFKEYQTTSDSLISQEDFEKTILVTAVEGGLTTEEYINLARPDWESPADIVAVAISIEAQALDLYLRAADRSLNRTSRDILSRIASEEKQHLRLLGDLLEHGVST